MRRLIAILGFLLCAASANSTTYYISQSSGANASNGLTKGTAWKTSPFMQAGAGCTGTGSKPTYVHANGDIFIFKQGDSWGNSCFPMNITIGGAVGNSDQETFDPTWGTAGGTTGNTGQAVGTYQFTAGGVVISGTNQFIVLNGVSNVTINGVELTGMTWTGTGGAPPNVVGIEAISNQNILISNMYCHGWTHSGATADALYCVFGYNYSPYGAGNRITGSVCDGVNSGGAGVNDSGACSYLIPTVDNTIAKNMTNGILLGYNALAHDNLVGPINVSFDGSAHENCFEPLGLIAGLTSTNYIYNNLWHDCYAVGILTQGGAGSNGIEKDYLWNNVVYVGAQVATIPMQFDSVSTSNTSSEVHAWNNTIYGGNNGGTGYCMHAVARGNGNFGVLDLQNNHCISAAPGVILLSITGNTFTNNNNVLMSLATATAQGYTSAQMFAYSPTSGGNATVGAGVNLSTTATGSFSTLANDSTYGATRSTNSRPGGAAAWDSGAYEFGNTPSPPTGFSVIMLGMLLEGGVW